VLILWCPRRVPGWPGYGMATGVWEALMMETAASATLGANGHLDVVRQAVHLCDRLIVAVGVLGYNLYQTNKEPEGVQINVGPDGLKIKTK